GDDVADVEPERRGFEPGDDTARAAPALGGVAGLGPGTVLVGPALGPAGAQIVGDGAGPSMEDLVAGQPKHVVDAVGLAPFHGLGSPVVAVAAPADAHVRPGPAEARTE